MRTKEERRVVQPLQSFLEDPKRSGAEWELVDRPVHGTGATGWDLQMERKNQILLVEAKYLAGPFLAAMAGLVLSPLTDRPAKKSGWCNTTAWAVGWDPQKWRPARIYQNFLDYTSRQPRLWRAYFSILSAKYLFLVDPAKRVARISFDQLMDHADDYQSALDWPQPVREGVAHDLLSRLRWR
jgi:hypothetical protein